MKTRFFLLILFAFPLFTLTVPVANPASAQSSTKPITIPEVVAKVNGVAIESKYIAFRMNQIVKNVKRPLTMREKTSIAKDLIDKEIVRELIHQQGKKSEIKIDEKLIDDEMAALRKPYTSDEEFETALKARNITLEDLKSSMAIDIHARQLLNEQIKGKINISDEDVKKYYKANEKKFLRPESFKTRHILSAIFPPDMLKSTPVKELQEKREALTQKAEERIDAIIKELKDGANFKELAKTKSDDEASRESGGDLDTIYKGILDPAFDEAVAKLKKGEVSGKVATRFGFHVIQLIEKFPSEQAPFEDMEKAIQKHLFMEEAKKLVEVYINGLKKQAKIEMFF
ncbi:MAG: hypothetical protein HOL15_03480 [Nitrospinaceae bacterium]|jgi:parvulin-like peptidyl-prolyl isomerase|nr:hypothetical protein [Nitrospina sp.]MBT5375855.1 hypothetical protein [Nitrospinaceae bacterium]MBT5869292.1 hypothetical protein [Nitrospinaceae bacterium]MBT6346042.1 hypothetical protein [Nitrospina sp.]